MTMQHLDWPFFEERHRTLARELDAWAHEHVSQQHGHDVDAECLQQTPNDHERKHSEGGVAEQLSGCHSRFVTFVDYHRSPQVQWCPRTMEGSGAAMKSNMMGARIAIVGTSIAAKTLARGAITSERSELTATSTP